jgi:putative FmdB family regulatory protein
MTGRQGISGRRTATGEDSVPTYQYACTECGHRFEAVQAFTDDSMTVCPVCSGQLRKVYGSVGVVFKGSGFYRTDSRADSTSTAPSGSPDKPSTGDKGSAEKGSAEKGSAEKGGAEKGGADRSGADRSGADRSGADRSGDKKAAASSGDSSGGSKAGPSASGSSGGSSSRSSGGGSSSGSRAAAS